VEARDSPVQRAHDRPGDRALSLAHFGSGDELAQFNLGLGELALKVGLKRRKYRQPLLLGRILQLLGDRPNPHCTKIARTALHAVRGPGLPHRVTRQPAGLEFLQPLGRIPQKKGDDLAQERIIMLGAERPEVFDGLVVNERNGGPA